MRTGHTLSQRPQKVEALGRWPALSTPISDGVEHRAHRAGIDPAVSVAADRVIDGAMVHARAAADAAQHVLEARAEHGRAAVVEDDDVVLLGPVRVSRAARAGGERGVDATSPGPSPSAPARAGSGEASSSVGTIFSIEAMTMWTLGRICVRSPLPSLVTMIEVPVSAIRKFAPVMPTSAARKRSRSTRARLGEQLDGLGEVALGVEMRVHAAEIALHLRRVEMHGRRDDVARHLVAQLDDVFAEVGLDRPDAGRFERGVEPDLLGDHRLALGDGLRADARQMARIALARLLAPCAAQCTWPPAAVTFSS